MPPRSNLRSRRWFPHHEPFASRNRPRAVLTCQERSAPSRHPMSWSISIGRIAGTAVRIHITFLLFLVWIWAASYVTGGAEAAWSGLAFMILLFLCVLAHEFGHIFTARGFGIPTPDVTLLPIGGGGRLGRIPGGAGRGVLIAAAA